MQGLYQIAQLYIFLLFGVSVILATGGLIYSIRIKRNKQEPLKDEECPFISVLVPAHNEEKVIYNTVKALLQFNYPKDKFEVIVINDNSSDNTKGELERAKKDCNANNLIIINTDKITGGKGKSNALNLAYARAKGEYIAVYDADNTAEPDALRYLATKAMSNKKYGAVIGKFRTRNRNSNLLTRFINIETLSYQWVAQAGRWQTFGLCSIPGTNFIVKKEVVEKIGGWDPKAICEDTEISFRIYHLGYKIAFMPKAVTWQQEPETLKVWFKQRTRWCKGNMYVMAKFIKNIFKYKPSIVLFDIFYFSSIYFLFLLSLVISDSVFILSLFKIIKINALAHSTLIWILLYVSFIIQIYVPVFREKGEFGLLNIILVPISYFTYCQLWVLVSIKSFVEFVIDIVGKREVKWYKTERF